MNFILKMLHFVYQDLAWKIIALALAFMLWFVGINVNNPIQNVIYDNVPLTILNRDRLALNHIVMLNEQQVNNARISLSVRATRNNHALINAARSDNIQASIDLNNINFEQILQSDDVSTVTVDVNVFVHQEHSTIFPHPSTVELVLDLHGERVVPISVDILGDPAEGFEMRPFSLSPRNVRLTGARSILNSISEVRAQISVGDATETVEEPRPLLVLNNDLQDIASLVNLNVESTDVVVPIFPYEFKPLAITTAGAAMQGFMVTEINISPANVELVGSLEELSALHSLVLGEIDLTALNDTVEYTFDIRAALAGTNLTLRADAPQEANVNVIVEEVISRTMYMPLANLAISNATRDFSFVNDSPILLIFHGRESAINALNINNITATADLAGLGAGTHNVHLQVNAPPRVALANLATVQISIEPEEIVFEPEEPPDFFADGLSPLPTNGSETAEPAETTEPAEISTPPEPPEEEEEEVDEELG